MFVTFFHELKAAGVPVTLREYLTLMQAMDADLAGRRVEDAITEVNAHPIPTEDHRSPVVRTRRTSVWRERDYRANRSTGQAGRPI